MRKPQRIISPQLSLLPAESTAVGLCLCRHQGRHRAPHVHARRAARPRLPLSQVCSHEHPMATGVDRFRHGSLLMENREAETQSTRRRIQNFQCPMQRRSNRCELRATTRQQTRRSNAWTASPLGPPSSASAMAATSLLGQWLRQPMSELEKRKQRREPPAQLPRHSSRSNGGYSCSFRSYRLW